VLARAHRHDTRLAILFLDLDGLKPVNDALGHEAGDAVLVEVARRLLGIVRETDTLARVGGDEFVIVMGDLEIKPGAAEEAARPVAGKFVVARFDGERFRPCRTNLGVHMFAQGGAIAFFG